MNTRNTSQSQGKRRARAAAYYHPDKETSEYHLSSSEIFARAYAAYIVHESGDAASGQEWKLLMENYPHLGFGGEKIKLIRSWLNNIMQKKGFL